MRYSGLHKYIIGFIFCSIQSITYAQRVMMIKALKYNQLEKYDSAIIYIDSASIHPETKNDPFLFQYRGAIYRNYYINKDVQNKSSRYRKQSIDDFFIFLELSKDDMERNKVQKTIEGLVLRIYNDAVSSMYEGELELSQKLWAYYRESYMKLHPKEDFTRKDIDYHKGLAVVYSENYDSLKTDDFFIKTEKTYMYVLSKDSNDWSANYNLGVLYYNKIADEVQRKDYDTDLLAIVETQEKMTPLMRKALPFLQKAYQLNPKHRETLIGLSGIYYNFYEYELAEQMQEELKLLDQK